MAFGKKAPEKPKAVSFYLNKDEGAHTYSGEVGEGTPGLVKFSPTGKAILETMGQTFWANQKENQHGVYYPFVIDGHFWFGKEGTAKAVPGKPPRAYFQLKQGGVAQDSAEWKAKQQGATGASVGSATLNTEGHGGSGPAGLAAPAGQTPGVQIQAGSVAAGAAPAVRPPKPKGYARPAGSQ